MPAPHDNESTDPKSSLPKHALVVGAKGFIGSAITNRLSTEGAKVSRLIRDSSDSPEDIHWDDLAKRGALSAFDTVFYCASTTTPATRPRSALRELEENLTPLLRWVDLLDKHEGISFVYLSSGGSIHADREGLLDESQAPMPLTFHGSTKVAAEAYLAPLIHEERHRISILRPSNVYGPGQIPKPGFGLIATLFDRILRGEAIELFRRGEDRRDFLYIDDLVDAALASLNGPSGTWQVAAGESHQVIEVVRAIENLCERTSKVILRDDTLSPARSVTLSIDRIQKQLGWQPRVSLLDGLKRTHEWWLSEIESSHRQTQRSHGGFL